MTHTARAFGMRESSGAPPGDALEDWLVENLGVRLVSKRPVGGGCIHSAWCLSVVPSEGVAPRPGTISGGRLFAKTNTREALPLLEAEAEGLEALARAATDTDLRVPAPLGVGVAGNQAVLVLPWLELAGGSSSAAAGGAWGSLGAALATLHRSSLEHPCISGDRPGSFGWPRDNVIGSGPQRNGWLAGWGRFFAERRLAPQIERLEGRIGALEGAQALLERVPDWLDGHGADPCLVHGDLWSGNAAIDNTGHGVIFDPAVHRADREVDLAMARLFGGFPAPFFAGYQATWPLAGDYRRRIPLYNLYHLLNHANLFGGSYAVQAQEVIKQLMRDRPA
jgi:fructosamine-3-kinase